MHLLYYEGSRVGRQPNAIKYYCVREISQRQQNGVLVPSEEPSDPNNLAENVSSHSPNRHQPPPLPAAGFKRTHNTFETVIGKASSSSTVLASTTSGAPLATDGGETRSRASTLSDSSGVSSSGTAFQNPLEPQQTSPVVPSTSSLKKLKVEEPREYDPGTDMVDSSFCQQLASATAASSFANHFLLCVI